MSAPHLINRWQHHDYVALQTVPCFKTMLHIALKVLDQMPTDRPVLQVCGPMSTGGLGDLSRNMRRFRAAVDVLHQNGYNVFDQLPFQESMIRLSLHLPWGVYSEQILTVFYAGIFKSGHIKDTAFLPGWHTSKGTRWERRFIRRLPGRPIKINEYPEHLLQQVYDEERDYPMPGEIDKTEPCDGAD